MKKEIDPDSDITYHSSNIPSYFDLQWDTMPKETRDNYALIQAKNTALFAKKHVPFYRIHFQSITDEEIMNISSLQEFAFKLPVTTKKHLSENDAYDFLPDSVKIEEMINKGTGGTTGKPVTIYYSQSDWKAMSQHIARSIRFDFRNNLDDLKGLKVVGMYHGDHVTNDVYRDGLKLLGVHLSGRVSTKKDAQSNYDFLQHQKPNGILAPPADPSNKQTKGITLDEFLRSDAKNSSEFAYRFNNNINHKFKLIFWSSMPLPKPMFDYMSNHLNIPYIQGQYGSTECCPTGATCKFHPREFHLGYGPTLVSLIHPTEKRLVGENERGHILVTKTGGTYNGKNIVPTGTFIINLRTGDSAVLKNVNGEQCNCGRNTPILTNLKRIEYIEVKADAGCQVD